MANNIARRGNQDIARVIRNIDPRLLVGAINAIRYGGNMARHTYDYLTDPGLPNNQNGQNNNEVMEADSTTNEGDNPELNIDSRANDVAGSSRNWGSFIGNTSTIPKYEKYFHERMTLHSKKIKSFDYNWGISRWVPWNSASKLEDRYPQFRVFFNNPGTVCYFGSELTTVNSFYPMGVNIKNKDIGDYVYTHALNPVLEDFIDNKLLDFSSSPLKGIMANYFKFRLKKFSIEITPKTYNKNTYLEQLVNRIHYNNNITTETLLIDNVESSQEIAMDYWVFREKNNEYTGSSYTIPDVPPDSDPTVTSASGSRREAFAIRNRDRNLCIMNNKKPFK